MQAGDVRVGRRDRLPPGSRQQGNSPALQSLADPGWWVARAREPGAGPACLNVGSRPSETWGWVGRAAGRGSQCFCRAGSEAPSLVHLYEL